MIQYYFGVRFVIKFLLWILYLARLIFFFFPRRKRGEGGINILIIVIHFLYVNYIFSFYFYAVWQEMTPLIYYLYCVSLFRYSNWSMRYGFLKLEKWQPAANKEPLETRNILLNKFSKFSYKNISEIYSTFT